MLSDGKVVSTFESDSDDTTKRIAVALSAKRQYEKHFRYIEITEADLQGAGIEKTKADGTTPLPDINDRHYNLTLNEDAATDLVRRVVARMNPAAIPRLDKGQVKALAREIQAVEGAPLPPGSWVLSGD